MSLMVDFYPFQHNHAIKSTAYSIIFRKSTAMYLFIIQSIDANCSRFSSFIYDFITRVRECVVF